MRFLPRSPRGTWLLVGSFWLIGITAVWMLIPILPRHSWPTFRQQIVIGFVPGTHSLVTKMAGERNADGEVIGPPTGPLTFWDGDTGQSHSWFTIADILTTIALSPDGSRIVVGFKVADGDRMLMYEAASGRELFTFPADASWSEVVFSPDGRWLVHAENRDQGPQVFGSVPYLCVRNVETMREEAAVPNAGFPCALSPDGRFLVHKEFIPDGQQWKNRARLWDVGASRPIRTVPGEEGWIGQFFRFSPDSRALLSYALDGSYGWNKQADNHNRFRSFIRSWNVNDGREVFRIETALAYFPRRQSWFLAVDKPQSSDGLTPFRVIDLESGQPTGRGSIPFDYEASSSVVVWDGLSPDGRWFASGDMTGNYFADWINEKLNVNWLDVPMSQQIKLHDIPSSRELATLPTDIEWFKFNDYPRVSFSHDSSLLAVISEKQVAIWDIPPRKPLAWYLGICAVLALPFAWLARRRVRTLRLARAVS